MLIKFLVPQHSVFQDLLYQPKWTGLVPLLDCFSPGGIRGCYRVLDYSSSVNIETNLWDQFQVVQLCSSWTMQQCTPHLSLKIKIKIIFLKDFSTLSVMSVTREKKRDFKEKKLNLEVHCFNLSNIKYPSEMLTFWLID